MSVSPSPAKPPAGLLRPLAAAAFAIASMILLMTVAARSEDQVPEFVRLFMDNAMRESEMKVAWGRAAPEGTDGFVLEEVSWAVKRKTGGYAPVGHTARIVFRGLVAGDDGLLTARSVTFGDTRFELPPEDEETDGFGIVIPEARATALSILKPGAGRTAIEKINEGNVLAGEVAVDTVRFRFAKGDDFVLSGLKGDFDGDRRTAAGHVRVDFGRLELPASAAAMAGRDDALGGLGYARFVLTGGAEWRSSWDEKERLHSDFRLRLGMEKAGELAIELGELVLPRQMVELMNDTAGQQRLEDMIDGKDPALLAKAQQEVTLRRLRLTWEDEGLTRRLIARAARREGMAEKDVIAAWAASPQAFLFMFGLPELGMQASAELKKFLEHPQRLEISMEARAPMSFATLMTLIEDAKGLVETLNLRIVANGGSATAPEGK